jgi:hypothetical protein
MRKVLSFVLVLALVLGSFSMAFADSHMFSDMSGEASSEAVTVLKDLGVVAGYPDGTFRPDQIVTRAEMARFIVAALGLEQFAVGTISKYPDMVQAPWAQGVVAYGTSLGFISGYPDGTFKPNQQVSFQEAASMLVRALGYTEAFLPGGWPAEWMIKANSLGIFDDVTMASGAAGADRGAIAQMLYNSLTLEIGQVNNDNVWEAFKPEDTMMTRLGVKTTTTAALEYTADSKINIISKVGVKGTIYWDGDDIISVKADSTQLTGKYNAGTKKFDVGSTAYSFKTGLASTDVDFYFENAELVDEAEVSVDDSTKMVTLAVKLSGTTITEIHSLSVWTETKAAKMTSAQVKAIADNDEVLLEVLGTDVEGNVDTNSFLLVGADSLSDIAKDDVVYVYTAADADEIRMIAVGTDTVSGRVTAKNSAGTSVTIGGKAYKIANKELWNVASNPTINVGDEYDVWLDAYGYIYTVDGISVSLDNYGVMLAYDAGLTDLDDARLRLFLADGTTKVFYVDSDVTVTYAKGGLVAYSVDKDGWINDIDYADHDTTAKLTSSNIIWINGVSSPIDSAAVVFTAGVTLASITADDLDVTTVAKVEKNEELAVAGHFMYFFNDDDEVIAMVINDEAGAVTDDVYAVVNSYTVEWDAVNESTYDRIKGFADGAALDSPAIGTGFGAGKAGMGLYMITFNSDNEIKSMTTESAINSVVTFSGLNAAGNAISVTDAGLTWYGLNLDDLVVYEYVKKANGTFDKYVISDIDNISAGNVVHLYDTLGGTGNDGVEVVIWWK